MKTKNILITLVLVLVCFIIVVLKLSNTWLGSPLKETAGKALFNSKSTQLNLECSQDLLGATNHGEAFEFYEYSVSSPRKITIVADSSFPIFQDGLYDHPSKDLQSISASSWQSTPIQPGDKLHTSAAEFGNLQEYSCSKQFVNNDYINQPGNFYAYFSAYPVGNFIYVWVPTEQKLFLIKKRG